MLELLVLILLSLGAISARSIQGDELIKQLDLGKRSMFDDRPLNGNPGAGRDDDWFVAGPGKRNSGAFDNSKSDKRCLNFFTNGCSNGNGSGLMDDEDTAGEVGKREAALQDPQLYKLLAYLYYHRKISDNNAERFGDGIPDERLLYSLSH